MAATSSRSPSNHCIRAPWIGLAVILTLGGALPPPALGDWTETFTFEPGRLRTLKVQGYDELVLPGCIVDAPAGAPRLPVFVKTFAVPEGEAVVGVDLIDAVTVDVPGSFDLLPGGGEIPGAVPQQDAALWARSDAYPETPVTLGGTGSMAGVSLASVLVHPVRFIPAEGRLVFHPQVTVRIRTEPSAASGVVCLRPRARGTDAGRWISLGPDAKGSSTQDVQDIRGGRFQPTEYPSLDGSSVEYLIITSDALATEFERLADWKTECGVPAAVKTVSWIEANYAGGVDLPEKIRLFIRDAYQYWGTVWVLLAGDTDEIPVRLAHSNYYSPGDWLITCDMYYQCLDGNWNGDGDHLFGEGYTDIVTQGDAVDLYPDVYLGRAAVETVAEAAAFIDNAIEYRTSPASGYLTDALFLGEVVFPQGWNPGDPVFLDGADICEQSADWFPSTWDTTKLYEVRGTENHASILNAMNTGYGVVVVVNHGDAFKMSCSDDSYLCLSDMDALQNFGKLGFIYASNCNLSQIEMDCFNEHLLQNPDKGYIGAMGSTRFCFPHAGRDFQEEVFRLLFDAGVHRMGELQALHKVPFVPVSSADNSAYRWTILSYLLLGDPELPIWTQTPRTLSVSRSGSMSLGDSLYTVAVTSGGSPVGGLTVCLWKADSGEYARTTTSAAGQAVVSFEPGSTGSASLVVIGDGYVPYDGTVTIAGTGRVQVSAVAVDDAASGNGDGQWDAGETVDLDVTLRNGTSQQVSSVTAALGVAGGSTLTVDMTFDGTPRPDLLFLGRDGESPASLPATYSLTEDVLLGRPMATGGAPADSGVYLWVDASGWHARTAGGLDAHTAWVQITTDGSAMDVEPYDLETDDTLTPGAAECELESSLDDTDFEDGVDLVFAEDAGVTIVDGSAGYGTIGAGLSHTESFTVSALASVTDRSPRWLVLDITGGGKTWSEWIRMDLCAPDLAQYFHGIDDSTYGGNRNAKAEVGEIVIFRPALLNRGSGRAGGVSAILRSVAGVDVNDSTSSIGAVPAGSVVQASDGFVFLCLSSSMAVSLKITDDEGRVWKERCELTPTSAPTGLQGWPGETWIDLRWTRPSQGDLFGYNVYRRSGSSGPFTRVTALLDEGTSSHRDPGLSSESAYEYRVTAVDTSGNESAATSRLAVSTAAPLAAGFPVRGMNQFFSSPALGDLDHDGDLEIVVGSKDGYVYAWHHTGALVAGWPKNTGGEVWSSPCLADLDADHELEVLVGSLSSKLFAWNANGTGYVSGDGVFASPGGWVRSSPAVQDVDFDGKLEIFAGCANGKVYAWNWDGTGYLQPSGLFANIGGAEISSSPAIVDLEGDKTMEIFVTSLNGNVYAWNHDGTALLPSGALFASAGGGVWGSPAVGDIDANGDIEIVAASFGDSVYAWNHDGTRMPNWPRYAGSDIWSSPALGDIDGDGDLEVAVGSTDRKMYAWHHTGSPVGGSPGLATAGGAIWSSAALVDINEDGQLDVIAGSLDGYVNAWTKTGQRVAGWPVRTWDGVYSSPAVGDLDNDGDLEVVAASYDGMLYCWDLSAAANPDAADWPMYHHDMHRTGYHGFTGFLDVADGESAAAPAPGLGQNYPNPFNPETVIAYSVGSPARVDLDVYDVTGRHVATLVSEHERAGVYRVVWRGESSDGKPVASGVYFCRLRVGDETFSKKMVLMK